MQVYLSSTNYHLSFLTKVQLCSENLSKYTCKSLLRVPWKICPMSPVFPLPSDSFFTQTKTSHWAPISIQMQATNKIHSPWHCTIKPMSITLMAPTLRQSVSRDSEAVWRSSKLMQATLSAFQINDAIPFNEDGKSVRKPPSFTALQSQTENYQTVDRWLTGAG